jgi:hypothetical protein
MTSPYVRVASLHQLTLSHESPQHVTRFFGKAQVRKAVQLAPYALEMVPTTLQNVRWTTSGMAPKPDAEKTKMGESSTPPAKLSASIGNDPKGAQPETTTTDTNVQAVEDRIMELNIVLALRKSNALTPYKAQAWQQLLSHYNLLDKYPHLLHQIWYGFDAGIRSISETFTPENSPTLHTHSDEYFWILDRELSTGRYIGPLSQFEVEHLLGPFQTSPLSLVPKSGRPGRCRAVHNFSYPHSPSPTILSINYTIDSNLFPCTWGTFSTLCYLVWNLPPGSQASVRDMAEAYRTIPITPEQWPGLVVKLCDDNQFAINTNNNFGLTSAGGVHGNLGDAAVDIFRASGIGPVSKWVDDHIFIRILCKHLPAYNEKRRRWHSTILTNGGQRQNGSRLWYQGETLPDGRPAEFDEDARFPLRDFSTPSIYEPCNLPFTYCDADIDHLSHLLGIPWESSKMIPFSSTAPYLGFIWDLERRTVSLPDTKKCKYHEAIANWNTKTSHTLQELQQIYRKLLHASLIVPMGRAYLTSLETMLGIFHNRPFMPRTPPKGTASDLLWWTNKLSSPILTHEIPGPVELIDKGAYSDASSGVEIAITIRNRWRAWRLLPGWKSEGRDIGWAEAIGFEFLVKSILPSSSPGDNFKIFGDNRGVIEGWWKGRSKNKATNSVFRRIHDVASSYQCTIHSQYVPSKENPADDPSRGIYPPESLLLPAVPIPAEISCFVINYNRPQQPTEIDAYRRGNAPAPCPKPAKDPSLSERAAFSAEALQWGETLLTSAEDW